MAFQIFRFRSLSAVSHLGNSGSICQSCIQRNSFGLRFSEKTSLPSSFKAFKSTKPNYAESSDEAVSQTDSPDELNTNNNYVSKGAWKSLTGNHQHPEIDLTFNNGQEAYKSKRNSEVIRALLVFNLCSLDVIVNNQKSVSRFIGLVYF